MEDTGVPIEDYRGPLLAKLGTPPRGANFTHFPSNVTLTPEPPLEPPHGLARLFYADDWTLMQAKRAFGWMLAMLVCLPFIPLTVIFNSSHREGFVALVYNVLSFVAACSPFLIIITLVMAMMYAIRSLRNLRYSQRRRLVIGLSIAALTPCLLTLLAAIFFVVVIIIAVNSIDGHM